MTRHDRSVTKRAPKAQRAPLEVAADHLGTGLKRGKPARWGDWMIFWCV